MTSRTESDPGSSSSSELTKHRSHTNQCLKQGGLREFPESGWSGADPGSDDMSATFFGFQMAILLQVFPRR